MLKKFSIDIEPEAVDDIQTAIDYYNSCKSGLGKRFYNAINKHFIFLENNYTVFAVRYDDIRCMPLETFPYLIHYRVLESQQTVSVKAVFCTHDDPKKWEERAD